MLKILEILCVQHQKYKIIAWIKQKDICIVLYKIFFIFICNAEEMLRTICEILNFLQKKRTLKFLSFFFIPKVLKKTRVLNDSYLTFFFLRKSNCKMSWKTIGFVIFKEKYTIDFSFTTNFLLIFLLKKETFSILLVSVYHLFCTIWCYC